LHWELIACWRIKDDLENRFSNVLGFVSYSPIWSSAAIYYGIADVDLTWLGNMYYLTYFTLAPFFIIPLEWRFDYCM